MKYTKWHSKNVHPECKNRDCLRMDRGSSCGLCAEWQKKKV